MNTSARTRIFSAILLVATIAVTTFADETPVSAEAVVPEEHNPYTVLGHQIRTHLITDDPRDSWTTAAKGPTLFQEIVACRFVSTLEPDRYPLPWGGLMFQPNENRTYEPIGVLEQNLFTNPCSRLIPREAVALSLRLTSYKPDGKGDIYLAPGSQMALSDGKPALQFKDDTVTMDEANVLLRNGKFSVASHDEATHLTIDIIGYFIPDVLLANGGLSQPGEKGDKGDRGDKGDKGDKGDAGITGVQGEKGAKGDKGDKGDTGLTGTNGRDGEKGPKGDAGPKGDKGDTGTAGRDGQKGDKGDVGPKGDKGDKGVGEKGPKGDVGPKGDKGDKGYGEKGPKGDAGPKGDKGDKGDKGYGEKGPKGDKGEKGDRGPKGEKGECDCHKCDDDSHWQPSDESAADPGSKGDRVDRRFTSIRTGVSVFAADGSATISDESITDSSFILVMYNDVSYGRGPAIDSQSQGAFVASGDAYKAFKYVVITTR